MIRSRLLAVVLLLTAACGKVVVTPPPPPPPGARIVGTTIRGAANPSATLRTDDGRRVECPIVRLVDGTPRAVCVLDPQTPSGWGAYLDVTAPEMEAQTLAFELDVFPAAGGNQSTGEVQLVPSFVALPALVKDGQFFRLATGDRFTVVEDSDFNLLARLAAGEDITPVLVQRTHDATFNTVRVFTAFDIGIGTPQPIGRLIPREHPDLYSVLVPKLLQLAAKQGARVELVGFTGPYASMFANDDEKVAHWEALKAAVHAYDMKAGGPQGFLELVNEGDHVANKDLPYARLTRPAAPSLASHGSSTQNADPITPFWDYITYHASEPRKVVHNCWSDYADPYNIPCVVNETVRVPDNDNSLAHAQDTAGGCALFVAGCTFHSIRGKNSALWGGEELALARAWSAAGHAVPLEFQHGYYVHRDDLEAACNCTRVYSHRLPDGREYIQRIRQ